MRRTTTPRPGITTQHTAAVEQAPTTTRVLATVVAVGVPAAALIFVGGGYRALAAYLAT